MIYAGVLQYSHGAYLSSPCTRDAQLKDLQRLREHRETSPHTVCLAGMTNLRDSVFGSTNWLA